MIPRVSKPGQSFKGAMLYFAHDQGRSTSQRLGFVELVNLPILAGDDAARDLERAGAIMAWTAIHQNEIRELHHHQTSPGTPYRRSGRKLKTPVYSFSLRFAPEDAGRIDDAMLKRAAHGALKALGLENCQAAILQHKDSIPPHVHVVVCPIDPKTGRTVSRSKDFLKLSRFAQSFSREHQLTILTLREDNNARRKRGEIVKYHDLPRSEWALMQGYRNKTRSKVERERSIQQYADRQQLAQRHKGEIARFKVFIAKIYRQDRDRIDVEIVRLRKKIGARGVFAEVTKFARKLTGRARTDDTTLKRLIKSRNSITERMNEARTPVARKLKLERLKMAYRHEAELVRDAQYFAWRERSRTEGDDRAAKQRRNTFVQASRDGREDGLKSLLAELRAQRQDEDLRQSLVTDDQHETRQQKWSRASGRNPDRPRRPRARHRGDNSDTPADRPRRPRRR